MISEAIVTERPTEPAPELVNGIGIILSATEPIQPVAADSEREMRRQARYWTYRVLLRLPNAFGGAAAGRSAPVLGRGNTGTPPGWHLFGTLRGSGVAAPEDGRTPKAGLSLAVLFPLALTLFGANGLTQGLARAKLRSGARKPRYPA